MVIHGSIPLRHRDDPSVQRDLNWQRHHRDLPVGLELQWLGTAGFRLSYADTTLLIDPYLSRASLREVASRRPIRSDAALIDRLVPRADAVLVGHTHFDHAVDIAHFAGVHGAAAYGSTSVTHLLGLHGLASAAVEVVAHQRYEIGPFTVRFVPSRHSKLIAGIAVPADGELTCNSLDHLSSGSFRCGCVWGIAIEVAGFTIYHQGSADLVDDEIRDRGVDVFLCGIAGRMWTRDFVERVIAALDPAVVVAHHHDDFFRPVESPMGFSFNVNLGGFVEDLRRVAPDVAVRTLDPLQTVNAGRRHDEAGNTDLTT